MAEIKQIKTTDGVVHDIEPANTLGLQVTNKAPTLAWDTTSTIATIDGTDITVKMPLESKYIAATTTTAGLMSAADKTKLNGIAEGAEVNVQSDWNATSGDAFIKNKPTILTIGTGATNAAAGNHTHNYASTAVATTTTAGLMSKDDKVKLNGIATGANKVTQASATGNTTTVASNSHIHSVTASGTLNSTGSHSHTVTASGTLNSTGSHSHTLTVTASTQTLTYVSGLGTTPCTSASSHTHSITATASTITNNITGSYSNGILTLSSGNVTYVSAVTKTGSAGGHSHTISLATTNQTIATGISSATSTAAGSHSHTFTGSSVNSGNAGSHSHTFTGSAVNSATPSGTTATTTVPTSGHTHGLA